jgi:AcrR family transcriptional regulator
MPEAPSPVRVKTARASGRRGPYAKTPARREQILATALETFSMRGFRASSLREIAESIGLTHPTILHHFGSKELLLAEVLKERDRASEKLFAGREDGLEVLQALRDVVEQNESQPGLVRLFTTLSAESTDPEHPAHGFFVDRYARVRAQLADALSQAQRRGQMRADANPQHEAAAMMALQDGLQVQWLLDDSFSMLAAFDAFMEKFCQGLDISEENTPRSRKVPT